jgi:hypothetical protein
MMRVSNRVIRPLLLSAIGLLCGLSCVCVQASCTNYIFEIDDLGRFYK